MPIQHARVNTLYALIGLNVLMFVVLVLTVAYVAHLGIVFADSGRAACERGNALREAARLSLNHHGPAAKRLAAAPRLAEQPCKRLYP